MKRYQNHRVILENIYISSITGVYDAAMKGDVKTMTGFGEAIYQRGIQCGEEIGFRHGELKKARETALSMVEDGIDIERIARLLKVREEDVRNWIEENGLLVK